MATETETKKGKTRALRPAPQSGVMAYPLDDELVVCDSSTGRVFLLNSTGTRVWGLCDGQRTIGAIARSFAELFRIPVDRALVDVEELIGDLASADLVGWQ